MERLTRVLGLRDAVAVGLGAMLGAGVFVALGPAAARADSALPLALALAGVIAWLNADSAARLAAQLPTSGGAYAWGRARLGTPAGVVAGSAFVLGKTLSSAAIAWAVGVHLWPQHARAVAVVAVVVLTALACAGLRRSTRVTTAVVTLVLVTLAALAVAAASYTPTTAFAPPVDLGVVIDPDSAVSVALATVVGAVLGPGVDVVTGAGILFFAFAGYARIATLGEEVRDPSRTLPRAVAVALGVVLLTYGVTAWTVSKVLGPKLWSNERAVADAAAVLGGPGWGAAVVVLAAVAALTSGLGVLLGLSRTTFAMARDGVLPRALARLSGPATRREPLVAQLVVGAGVVVALLLVDLSTAIRLSSAAVLVYYAVAHAAALTLPGRRRRAVPVLGLVGCLVIAATLVLG